MRNAVHIGRDSLAAAPGVGHAWRVAARTTVAIGAAGVVVMSTVVPLPLSTVSPAVRLAASSQPCTRTNVTCAFILGGTSGPTPSEVYIDIVKNQYIVPTHPDQDIDYVAVTTPEELWPVTGVARLLGLAVGDPRIFAFGAMAWPDEPLWKLSGLFDLTADRSVAAGADDLEAAIAAHPSDHVVIYGLSQGAGVANVVKKRLAEQYPMGTDAPDVDFVLSGDPNVPNGGWMARFAGLHIPILDLTFNGAAATDTQFDTVEINRQYDGFADFPMYPLNLVSTLNAVMGIVYLHTNSLDVSLPADPTTSPAYQGTHGDTSYYLFETKNLPLFEPLRRLGVPEKLIDVVQPVVKVIVDQGYDRSIPPWEPTPARLIPPLHPATAARDLLDAVGEGISNADNLVDESSLSGHARVMTSEHDVAAPDNTLSRGATTITNRLGEASGAVKLQSVGESGPEDVGARAAHATPLRDAITGVGSEVKKVVTKVSDGIKKALGGGEGESP